MIDGTFDGKPSVITKGLQSFYASDKFSEVSSNSILLRIETQDKLEFSPIFNTI